jgi:hypothetical protein
MNQDESRDQLRDGVRRPRQGCHEVRAQGATGWPETATSCSEQAPSPGKQQSMNIGSHAPAGPHPRTLGKEPRNLMTSTTWAEASHTAIQADPCRTTAICVGTWASLTGDGLEAAK